MRIANLALISIAACARAQQPHAPAPKELAVTAPSESHVAAHLPVRTGDVHDFDFLAGAWTIHNRTLKPGGEEWVEFPATPA